MSTKYINLTGTTKWVNGAYGGLFEPDPKYGNFVVRLYPDPASWDKFKKSGLRLEPKTDEDGDYVQFRRAEQKLMKKELVNFGRPKVFFKEGVEPTRNIGNGSTIEVNVAVYDTREGKGHRLESVKVIELVEFNREGPSGGFVEYTGDEGPREKPVAQPEEETNNDTGGKPFNDDVPFDVDPPKKSASPFKKMSR